MQVQITGDHILLSCNGLPHDEHEVDVLFLVNWKDGKVTSVGIFINYAHISTPFDIVVARDPATGNDLCSGIYVDLRNTPRIYSHGRKRNSPL
jgi:hypothetical protein